MASELMEQASEAYRQGNVERAREYVERALEQDPENDSAHNDYAQFLTRQDQHELAREHFERAQSLGHEASQQYDDYESWARDQNGVSLPSRATSLISRLTEGVRRAVLGPWHRDGASRTQPETPDRCTIPTDRVPDIDAYASPQQRDLDYTVGHKC